MDQGAGASSATEESSDSEASVRSRRVLEGYEAELGGGSPSLTYDLPNGQKWKKKIWPRAYCAKQIDRWNFPEEILSYLISFDQHKDWISTTTPHLPPSGSVFFFNKKETKTYRNDGHQWKTRRSNANCIREDRMKLKLHGYKLLYACYTHSDTNENFHRRSYWLLQNPDLIMVHYLEQSGNNQETVCLQNTEEEKRALIPSNLDFLTISDRNLCSLLNMVSSADDAVALMRQLALILHQNILKFRTILEVVEASNAILPFVKPGSIACKPSELGDQSSSGVKATPLVRRPLSSTVAALDTNTPSGLSLNPNILSQVLASNLLVFYPGEKSLNCIALNPTYNISTPPPPSKPDVTLESCTPMNSPQEEVSVNHSDYDADKFTQFANALIQMNPLETLQSPDTNATDGRNAKTADSSRSTPLPSGCTDRGNPSRKSPGVNSGQTAKQAPPHADLHVGEEVHPVDLTEPSNGSSSDLQSVWTRNPPAPWDSLGPINPNIFNFTSPAVELPECGTNVALTSLWDAHVQDSDPLHSWLKSSCETDEYGGCSSNPSDALTIELPQEIQNLVSSSEFFKALTIELPQEIQNLVSSSEFVQASGLPGNDLGQSGDLVGDKGDWEMDFSSQDCRGSMEPGSDSASAETVIPNLSQSTREQTGQSLFLFKRDCTRLDPDSASSPFPSSPSIESGSTHSSLSIHDPIFDTMDSPSVAELCEMLGESPNVQHCDFAHMILTENEQQQLLGAARIIQNAFRKYRCRRQMRAREKRAALLIERYYKRYKEIKQRH